MSSSEQQETILSDNAIVDEFKAWVYSRYLKETEEQAFKNPPTFTIDYNRILDYVDTDLTKYFDNNIDNAIESLKCALSDIMLETTDLLHENRANPDGIQIRIQNYDEPLSIRDITTIHNRKMIVANCAIAKASEEKPFMVKSVYLCAECGHHEPSPKNKYIKVCPSCTAENKMVLDTDKCVFTSYRNIVIQDLPEDLPAGHIPVSKPVTVFGDDLTHSDICRPGSRVKLTAIVRLTYDKNTLEDLKNNIDPLGILDAPSTGTTFALSLTANNIEPLGDSDNKQGKHHKLTKEDLSKILEYRKNPDLNTILVNSFAPHVFGHESIKECLLLALASSNQLHEGYRKRGDINILLVGNAGVGKSQMLLFAAKVSPRCIYVSGRGSSGVGLTAAVRRDEKSGEMMLDAGATVLADQGELIVDEFDKLRAEDRSALHEVMEQQTCSVAKGGIVATLNARISLLAAANPKFGTYDSFKTLAENTEYPPSLISRFDFIYVIKDKIDEKTDSDIANAILNVSDSATTNTYILDITFLSKYLQYVKSLPEPELSQEAKDLIRKHYISIRQKSEQDRDGTVSALTVTARLVDTLNRASISRAKLLQKTTVEKEDVQRVIKLLSEMFASFGVHIPTSEDDPNLGDNVKKMETINLGLLYGKPMTKLNKKKVFFEICDAITNNGKIEQIDIDKLAVELVFTRKFVTRFDADETIRSAIKEGILSQVKGDIYRYNRDMVTQS